MPRALIQLTVRVEPATYEAALRAAQAAGLSLSAWLAQVIRERAEQEPPAGPEAKGASGR
jgi:predicted HicB family RNase H-like nuclease